MGDLSSWIGLLLQTAAIIGAIAVFIVRHHIDFRLLLQSQQQSREKIASIESKMEKLSDVIIEIAKQDTRLNNLEARMQEISNRLFQHMKEEV